MQLIAFRATPQYKLDEEILAGLVKLIEAGDFGNIHSLIVNMAMFGYLYLKNGLLNGEQVVSEEWVKESTLKHIVSDLPFPHGSYGYQWWILPDGLAEQHPGAEGAYYALGYGGQYILVLPKLNMVVVITAENYGKHQGSAFTFLRDYIFPALKEN